LVSGEFGRLVPPPQKDRLCFLGLGGGRWGANFLGGGVGSVGGGLSRVPPKGTGSGGGKPLFFVPG